MPRPRRDRAQLSRQEAILELAGGWGLLKPDKILAEFPEEERAEILEAGQQLFYERRRNKRRGMLRERLQEWPVSSWGAIFAEDPTLLDELTHGQRTAWDVYRKSLVGNVPPPVQTNVLAFPASLEKPQ